MTNNKLPAFQFYPADWKKDPGVQACDFFTRHVWFEMLLLMHESDERGVLLLNGKPMSDIVIARLLNLDNQIFETCLTTLLDFGVAHRRELDNAIYNKRMVRDEEIRQIRKISGLQGGNPILLKQKSTTPVKQKSTPSSSISSSSTTSINNKGKAQYFFKMSDLIFPKAFDNDIGRNMIRAWLEHKKNIGKRYKSATAVNLLLKQWAEKGSVENFQQAVEFSISQNYQGIFTASKTTNGDNGETKLTVGQQKLKDLFEMDI